MRAIWFLAGWLWWFGVASIPYALHVLERRFAHSLGCPPRGDCYVPGWEILLDLDLLVLGTVALLWPVAAWFLIGVPLLALWRTLRA